MNYIPIIIFITFCVLKIDGDSGAPTCTTPMGEEGVCVPLRLCPKLKQVYCNGAESAQIFIEASTCKDRSFSVCCVAPAVPTTTTQKPTTTSTTAKPTTLARTQALQKVETNFNNNKNRNLLPNKRYCGMQHTDDYMYEGNDTAVDEFPWLAEIRCVNPLQHSVTKFPGVLISNRYILTTDKCQGNGKTEITLGKYTGHESCIMTRFHEKDCSGPEIKVTATEGTVYPNEKIVLLRLDKRITFTDYIRPICLPFEKKDKPKVHHKIASSGWGATNIGQGEAKKKVFYEVVTNDQCKEEDIIPDVSKSLCARRVTVQDNIACKSDLGSPVMFRRRHNWFIIGVLGDPRCTSKKPVLTNLINADVLSWILNTVRA